MNTKRLVIILTSTLLLILAFQNCTPTSQQVQFTEVSSLKIPSSDMGNGHGYDGKIFLVTGALCADQSHVRAKIVQKSISTAELVRKECQDIAPVPLTSNDFQFNPASPDELTYVGVLFNAQIPTSAIVLDVQKVFANVGFSYAIQGNYGTAPDNDFALTVSRLQLYEDGKAIGPAHSPHLDIHNLGQGRFSHWFDGTMEYLRFSATDNTNPMTNQRVYSYKVL